MSRGGRWMVALLAGVHLLCLGADLLAPYPVERQDRSAPYSPPTRVRFVDADGRFHLRPFVYARRPVSAGGESVEDRSRRYPLRFLVRGEPRSVLGLATVRTRLVAVDEPARLFLIGTDGLGRDRFSRLLYGGRISLFCGLLAAVASVALGLLLGASAGFYGAWADRLLMRCSELFLALPWLYLLFGVRAFLPLSVGPRQAFLLFIALIGLIGWARPARVFRGVALAARRREFVEAARSYGAGDLRLLLGHVLPQLRGVALTQLSLLIPQYIVAEVTLSFLGLGVAEPQPSWGTLLAELQEYHVLVSHGWMFLPGAALVLVILAYQRLADELHYDRVAP